MKSKIILATAAITLSLCPLQAKDSQNINPAARKGLSSLFNNTSKDSLIKNQKSKNIEDIINDIIKGKKKAFICYFRVPKVHRMQQNAPYTGKGNTILDAKYKALENCKKDLDFWKLGACNKFFTDSQFVDKSLMECTVNFPFPFPLP